MKNDRQTEIAFYLPSLAGGGAERAILSLANQFVDSGISIDLVLENAQGQYLSEASNGLVIIDLSVGESGSSILQLRKYLKSANPAVVMSALDMMNIKLILVAKSIGYKGKVVLGQRATIKPVYEKLKWFHRLFYEICIRYLYRLADTVVSNSYAASSELVDIFGISPRMVSTIQNDVDIQGIRKLSNAAVDDPWLASCDSPLIISVGSLTERKDVGTIIRAVHGVLKVRNVRLVLLGEGQQLQYLKELTTELDLDSHVYFFGFDVNPYRWMKRADLLVSASHAEGFPNIIAQALALNMRIVATNCPGDSANILENGRWGKLVPVGDHLQMAEAILDSLETPSQSDVSVRAKDFSQEKSITEYSRLLLG